MANFITSAHNNNGVISEEKEKTIEFFNKPIYELELVLGNLASLILIIITFFPTII